MSSDNPKADVNKLEKDRIYYTQILEELEPTAKSIEKNVQKLEKTDKTFVDFALVASLSSSKSQRLIQSFVEFFIEDKKLRKNDFIKQKIKMDELVLSKILYQIETSEYATTKLLEQIDEGRLEPRNFEVLAGLQKSNMDLLKFLVQIQNVMEMSYRNIYDNYLLKTPDYTTDDDTSDDCSTSNQEGKISNFRNVLEDIQKGKV